MNKKRLKHDTSLGAQMKDTKNFCQKKDEFILVTALNLGIVLRSKT